MPDPALVPLLVPLPVTALYAGLNALLLVGLAAAIPRARARARVGLGDGGDKALQQRIRAHGNLTEYLPIALILLALLELGGLPLLWLHLLGGSFTLGRILHPIALYRSSGGSRLRVAGMLLTWTPIALAALACLGLALPF